jgi:hypothetical protein
MAELRARGIEPSACARTLHTVWRIAAVTRAGGHRLLTAGQTAQARVPT